MAKILLDYAFPVTVIDSLPSASVAWLKKAIIVVKPKAGEEANVGTVYDCNNMSQVALHTDNEEISQFFNAGMSSVKILLADDLDIGEFLNPHLGTFFTLLISGDFTDADLVQILVPAVPEIKAKANFQDLTFASKLVGVLGNAQTITITSGATAGAEVVSVAGDNVSIQVASGVTTLTQLKTALDNSVSGSLKMSVSILAGHETDTMVVQSAFTLTGGANAIAEVPEVQKLTLGAFNGVIGIQSDDIEVVSNQAVLRNRAAFFANSTNKATNMLYAFGKLLSNALNWNNQQYITMPANDGVDELGEANALFDAKGSFVINDDEFGNVLGLFAASGKAIVAPYIIENLKINLQSRAIQWISANQPNYTIQNAKLMEMKLKEDVIDVFIARGWIELGTVVITIENSNFIASGYIDVSEPKALWRVFAELRQTL